MARISVEGSGNRRAVSVRQTTGSLAGSAVVNVVVVFPTALASTSYTVVASVEDASSDLRVLGVVSRTTADVTVRVQNVNTLTARTGSLHVIAFAD